MQLMPIPSSRRQTVCSGRAEVHGWSNAGGGVGGRQGVLARARLSLAPAPRHPYLLEVVHVLRDHGVVDAHRKFVTGGKHMAHGPVDAP